MLFALTAIIACAQHGSVSLRSVVRMPDSEGVYLPSDDVTSPSLVEALPVDYSDQMRQVDTKGTCLLAVIVGPDGIPTWTLPIQNFLQPFDLAARSVVSRLRFLPGRLRGKPVTTEVGVRVDFAKDASAAIPKIVALEGPVVPPVLAHTVSAKYPKALKKANVHGAVVIALTVNENGEPTDVSVSKSIDKDLDQSALEAVRQYRFKAASNDGIALSVPMTIAVNFDLN